MTLNRLEELPDMEAPIVSIEEVSIDVSSSTTVVEEDPVYSGIRQKVANGTPLSVEEKLIVFTEEHDKFLDTVGAVSGRMSSFLGRCASAWENRVFKLIPDIRELV